MKIFWKLLFIIVMIFLNLIFVSILKSIHMLPSVGLTWIWLPKIKIVDIVIEIYYVLRIIQHSILYYHHHDFQSFWPTLKSENPFTYVILMIKFQMTLFNTNLAKNGKHWYGGFNWSFNENIYTSFFIITIVIL